jgi:hypothetical protein
VGSKYGLPQKYAGIKGKEGEYIYKQDINLWTKE